MVAGFEAVFQILETREFSKEINQPYLVPQLPTLARFIHIAHPLHLLTPLILLDALEDGEGGAAEFVQAAALGVWGGLGVGGVVGCRAGTHAELIFLLLLLLDEILQSLRITLNLLNLLQQVLLLHGVVDEHVEVGGAVGEELFAVDEEEEDAVVNQPMVPEQLAILLQDLEQLLLGFLFQIEGQAVI